MPLFRRKYKVTIDTIKIDNLDVAFRISKSLSSDPNICDLQIYNLNPDHRAEIAKLEKPLVEVEAGYDEEEIGLIFRGYLREANSKKAGSDWVTELSSGDGEDAIEKSRINRSFKSGTPLVTVLEALAESMNVGIGNASQAALGGDFAAASNEFLNGCVLSGKSSTEMDRLMKSAGLEWSIQDEELQIMEIGQTLPGSAFRLAPDTGLIGSPTVGTDGIAEATSLMNWSITPGRQLQIESRELPKTHYRTERAEYSGDSSGNDWYITVEAKQI
jgi:hypothetical protein